MTNNDIQNITQKTKDRALQTPPRPGWTRVLRKGKQFLLSSSTTRRVNLATSQPCDKSWTYDGKYMFLFGFLCTITNIYAILNILFYF